MLLMMLDDAADLRGAGAELNVRRRYFLLLAGGLCLFVVVVVDAVRFSWHLAMARQRSRSHIGHWQADRKQVNGPQSTFPTLFLSCMGARGLFGLDPFLAFTAHAHCPCSASASLTK